MPDDDDGDSKRVLEVTPAAQAPDDAFPELPLGVEAFRSPLHTLPAKPPARESASPAQRAYFVVSTLAIGVGIFAALATRTPAAELTDAREDLVSSAGELRAAQAPKQLGAVVVPAALAHVIPSSLTTAPSAPERAATRDTPSPLASTATPPLTHENSPTRRDKRRGLQRSAAGRTRVKPAAPVRAQLPTRTAVLAAMRRVTREARSCLTANTVALVDIGFSGETGKVDAATVRGVTGAPADCVARAVRGAKLQPFAKPRLDITFPFRADQKSRVAP